MDNMGEIESRVLESYKTFRTNIEFLSFDKNLKTILITSSDTNEGKSTVTSNLALSLAEYDKKVILVDSNLRAPSIHKKFMIPNSKGLSSVIIGRISLEDAIISISNNLDIIPSGPIPPNPSEMLGSEKMREIVENIKEDYDYIILDAPAVLPVTDAQILSRIADGTILVVKAVKTKKDNVINAKKLLEKVKANIIGVVFNGAEEKKIAFPYEHGKAKKIKKKLNLGKKD